MATATEILGRGLVRSWTGWLGLLLRRVVTKWWGNLEEGSPSKNDSHDPREITQSKGTKGVVIITAKEVRSEASLTTVENSLPSSNDLLTELASNILDIFQRYGHHLPTKEIEGQHTGWIGKPLFMDKVKKQIEKKQAIRAILPAFPWKSINKVDKVIGVLPDLGEELALARLNQLCEDVKEVYPLGGEVQIATDGLVFDDVVGIPDENTWVYGEGLAEMIRARGYEKNIKIIRVMDILGYTDGPETMDKEKYLSLVGKCRSELLDRYGRTEKEVRDMMRDDPDTLLTYCGFDRFLKTDLRHSLLAQNATTGMQFRRQVKQVAIQMMIRAESFTKLLQDKFPDNVRLSIHPSSGAVKLSFPLVVQSSGDFPKSPWHSCVAVGLDGSIRTVHVSAVRDTHNLVHRNGRPHYYREKSDIWDWEDEDVVFEPQFPTGILVHPREGVEGKKVLTESQLQLLKSLRSVYSGVVKVTGFQTVACSTKD